jgi:hypothetical protein
MTVGSRPSTPKDVDIIPLQGGLPMLLFHTTHPQATAVHGKPKDALMAAFLNDFFLLPKIRKKKSKSSF